MELLQFKEKIKSGNLSGWYIFTGEEDYLKKHYINELRSKCLASDAFALFNHVAFESADIDFGAVKEALSSPPMMDEYKFIEWRFADLDAMKEGEKSALLSLFELKEEFPYAVFAIMTTEDGFDTGTPKKPSPLYKKLSEAFDIINFPKSTDAQLLSWLKKHFDAEGVAVDVNTLNALLFRSGHSMEVLNNEVIKLSCYAKANNRNAISTADVEEVASSTVECDAFALSNAVIDRNIERALIALTDFKQRRVEPLIVISILEKTYSELSSTALILEEGGGASDIETIFKFHPFKAKLYIAAAKKMGSKKLAASLAEICRIDAASKSGGISGYSAIEMFLMTNLKA